MTQHTELIKDGDTLTGARFTGSDTAIPVYDDGFGPMFILRDSMGVLGIVRAQTWEDAYGICEDEFFPEASETLDEIRNEYGFRVEHRRATGPDGEFKGWERVETPDPDAWAENDCFQEGFGFRPNGPNGTDTLKHGIYAKDLNGDSLDLLTPAMLTDMGIELQIERGED